MAHAPHLPEKKPETKISRIIIAVTLISVFFGVLSGASATLMMMAWVVPPVQIISAIPSVQETYQFQSTGISSQKERQISERIINVYEKKQVEAQAFNAQEAFVGSAVLLSTDGWSAMQDKHFYQGKERQWVGIDRTGEKYTVRVAYADSVNHIVYLQFIGENFQVSPIADWQQIKLSSPVVVVKEYTFSAEKISEERKTGEKRFDLEQKKYYTSTDSVSGLLFTHEGRFVGFVDSGEITLGYKVQYDIPFVLRGDILKTATIPLVGYVVTDINSEGSLKKQTAFIVTQVPYQFARYIRQGDIITHINDEPYSELHTPRQLLFSSSDITFTLMRNGSVEHVSIKK